MVKDLTVNDSPRNREHKRSWSLSLPNFYFIYKLLLRRNKNTVFTYLHLVDVNVLGFPCFQ